MGGCFTFLVFFDDFFLPLRFPLPLFSPLAFFGILAGGDRARRLISSYLRTYLLL